MALARYKNFSIDAVDPGLLAEFWAAALRLDLHRHDDGDADLQGPTPKHQVWITRVPERRTVKTRVHLDLVGTSVEEFIYLGARRLSEPGQFPWTVLADPEGNEFCVFVREVVGPQRLKDIVVSAADPAALAGWWARVFGVPTVADDGYHYLDGVPGAPVESLDFVPVPEPKTVKNRMHWDVDVDSVEALEAAGATVLRQPDDEIRWTVLTDPEGNEFCAFVEEGPTGES